MDLTAPESSAADNNNINGGRSSALHSFAKLCLELAKQHNLFNKDIILDGRKVLEGLYCGVLCGRTDDWKLLLTLARKEYNLLADAIAAVCYMNDVITIVDNDRASALKHGNQCFYWLREESTRGCKYSQFFLGMFFELGLVVSVDLEESLKLYRLSASQGFAPAQCCLGACLCDSSRTVEMTEGFSYCIQAANQNYAAAQYFVGCCWRSGTGVEQNEVKALQYFQMAAEQGYAPALASLSFYYFNGIVVAQNENEGFRLCCTAAQQGLADAEYQLGCFYESGYYVDGGRDVAEAVRLFERACKKNNSLARYKFADHLLSGTGCAANVAEAVRLMKISADDGICGAQAFLGAALQSGLVPGIKKNIKAAVKYLKQAVKQGSVEAMHDLGRCYYNGEGIAEDLAEAIRLFTVASDSCHAGACCDLAICYESGVGIGEKDTDKAMKLYQMAASQGNSDAQYHLAVCYFDEDGSNYNPQLAREYCRLAADQHHPSAIKLQLKDMNDNASSTRD
jgi:TPR repeat protein